MTVPKNVRARNLALCLFLFVFVLIFYGLGMLRIKGA